MNYIKLASLLKTSQKIAFRVLNTVLPPRCPQTGEVVPENGTLSSQAWAKLNFIAPPFCACCGMPFTIIDVSEINDANLLCGPCLEAPPPYHIARSVFTYDDASRSLILGFKHGDKTHLSVTFAPLLARAAKDMLEQADILTPVPLHWRRLLSRRYNQSAILCHALTKETGLPTFADLLKRTKHTLPQGHKKAPERHANVRKVFALNPVYKDHITGKHIILIDDVLTTGATIEECTRTLIQSGAAQVDILTLARVVKNT